MEKATGKVVILPGEQTSTELAEAEAAASSTQAKDKPESLMEMKSAAHQVSKLGFSIGACVTNKGAEHVQVFEVIAVSEESAVLLERGLVMTSAPQSMTVSLKELTDDWKPFKGKVTCPLKGWSPEVGSPIASEEFCWEVLKGKISQAMMKAYDKNVRVLQHMQLMQNPKHGGLQHRHAAQRIVPCGRSHKCDEEDMPKGDRVGEPVSAWHITYARCLLAQRAHKLQQAR